VQKSSRSPRPNAESRAALPAEGKPFRFTRPVSWLWVHPRTRLPAFAVALWVLVTLHSCGAAPDLHRLPVDRVSRKLDDTGNHVKRGSGPELTRVRNFPAQPSATKNQPVEGSEVAVGFARVPRLRVAPGEWQLDSDFFFWKSRKRLLVGEGSRWNAGAAPATVTGTKAATGHCSEREREGAASRCLRSAESPEVRRPASQQHRFSDPPGCGDGENWNR
jgi:hypothetical protein